MSDPVSQPSASPGSEERTIMISGGGEITTITDPAAELDAWVRRHIQNSRFSQSTDVYNRIAIAVAQIKAAINSVA